MAQKFEIGYNYQGFMYRIWETDEVHGLLDDPSYFLDYISENSNSIEIETSAPAAIMPSISPDDQNVPNENAKHFSWTVQVTKLLLQAYLEKKEEFRDPKIKKRKLWAQICETFKNKGYIVTEEILDKKLRNLKCHYKTIKDNNNKTKTGRGRVTWDYYDLMESIFVEDKTINPDEVLSSMTINLPNIEVLKSLNVNALSNQFPEISTSPNFISERHEPNEQPQALGTNRLDGQTLPPPKNLKRGGDPIRESKCTYGRNLYKHRQNMAEIEHRRVLALERVADQLEEYNNIQKERNDLIKQYLSKLP